ncbi:heavy metal-associated isoprenylated plant protein 9 [Eucalyptus grandis]|uniref:Uncharacterized protein n=2 Tax=Eucalyptus globulus TaxID=34317 RepID=A0ABD3LFY4_EUCGL|nr:heavy metal-associated isoprenylated plant protein 9 [Eucalyptus grandis]
MTGKFYCMVLRINIDCNGCYRKVQRALLQIRELENHLIEEKQCRVIVCGKFVPQDMAIALRKKTNRRVEILEIQELGHGEENEEGGGEHTQSLVPRWGPVPNQKQVLRM